MPVRLPASTSHLRGLFEPLPPSICLRCARKITRQAVHTNLIKTKSHGDLSPRSHISAPSRRDYRVTGEKGSVTAGVVKDHELDRRFFWANAFQGKRPGQQVDRRESWRSAPVATSAATNAGAEYSSASSLSSAPSQTPISASATTSAEEPPHRRRKRLKEEARTAAAAAAAAEDEKQLPLDASSTLSQDAAAAPARSFRRVFSTYLALTKPRLAFLIVLTTTASYSIYPVPALLSTSVTSAPSLSTLTLLFLTTGTFMAIASANTLNMLFEPQHDAKMSRTRNRPLVRGLIKPRSALIFACATGLAGTLLLWYGVNPTTAVLGFSNIILYACIYTPLKRIHPVNTWVGAIVGAIAPLMGWCAAGSQYTTTTSSPSTDILSTLIAEPQELLFTPAATGGWLLAALLFAWQFPHFFALSHGVRAEYAGAGYRMLTSTNIPMAARVSLRYSLAMFPICVGLSYTGVADPAFAVLSSGVNGWMAWEAWRFWRLNGAQGSARALFWASVWQLPIVLVLAMVLKKGLWGRIWRGVFGEDEVFDDDDDEYED